MITSPKWRAFRGLVFDGMRWAAFAAAVAAMLLLALAAWLGFEALSMFTVDEQMYVFLEKRLPYMGLNDQQQLTYLYHRALICSLLAIAAVIPVPGLIRIAANGIRDKH